MLLEALSTARDLGRLHDIARVMIRYGLGDLVRRLGIARWLARAGHALRGRGNEPVVEHTSPEQLRHALEELGPTFVKVGQLLAGRSDLLPPAWTEALAELQDRVAPADPAEVAAQLEQDLGAPPQRVFARFEPEPMAAGSIAQVHRARLTDGTEVVLKVRRPGIDAVIETDLRLLARLAALAERELPELRRYRPRELVRQFARSLRQELDMRAEAQHAVRLAAALATHQAIVVPGVHARFTTARLCVMDFAPGPNLRRCLQEGMPAGVDRHALAGRGADAVLGMVFERGFFHADPHAGNLVLLPDGRLALLDFGMVGHLTAARREELHDLLMAAVAGREAMVVDVLLGWAAGSDTDVDLLAQDTAALVQRYRDLSLEQLEVTALLGDVARLLRDHDLMLPPDIAMLLKVFVTLEGLGRELDPAFAMAAHLEPFARRAFGPRQIARRVRRGLRDSAELAASLPRHTQRLLLQLRRGALRLDVNTRQLDDLGAHLERAANRLAVGLITAALIIGTAVALAVSGGPQIAGMPAFALLGFLSSILAGVWLLWSMLRSGKR